MGEFVRVGCGLWYWEPFIELPYRERNLWLGIYSSGDSKRLVPGLFHGGIGALSNAAKMPSDDVLSALDELIRRRMVAYDQRKSVVRLCMLPDAGEKPFNGAAVRGWWNRFVTVPACRVRDEHVLTLKWILDTAASTADHLKAWNDTFAKLEYTVRHTDHPPGPSGLQPLTDNDTSTKAQPGLFSARNKENQGSGSTTPGSSHVDPDPKIDLSIPDSGSEVRPLLRLVPEPTPAEIANVQASDYSRTMHELIRAAGGAHLIDKTKI